MKIAVSELEQMLTLLKKTSTDVHVNVHSTGMDWLSFSFTTVDGEFMSVKIYEESTRSFAQVTSSERLGTVLQRCKK